jgi:hypothetical protein
MNKMLDGMMYLIAGILFVTFFLAVMLGDGNKGLLDLF